MNVQQTPNPEAQFPSAVPPLLVHSVAEKQVPNTSTDEEDFPVHWLKRNPDYLGCWTWIIIVISYSLGNVTTEKSEKTFFCLCDGSTSTSAPEAIEHARKKTSPIFCKSTILM